MLIGIKSNDNEVDKHKKRSKRSEAPERGCASPSKSGEVVCE